MPGSRGFLMILLIVLSASLSMSANAQVLPSPVDVPVRGMVTMVDVGADNCAPCRMMAPMLAELEKEYRGRAAIVVINVGKDRDRAKVHGARLIPTQIFYDREGREVARHEGFMDRKSIVEMLERIGAAK